jgi:hypothetical protein
VALEEVEFDYPTTGFPQKCPFPQEIDALLNEEFWQSF